MTALAPRWHTALISALLATGSLVVVAWAKMDTVQLTYEVDRLVDEEDRLAEEQRRLRTELAGLRAPARLEEMALALGLSAPRTGQVVVVTGEGDSTGPPGVPPSVPPATTDSAPAAATVPRARPRTPGSPG